MMLLTYKAAKMAGDKFYMGRSPCINGHDAPRRTSSRACLECIRNNTRQWEANNRNRANKLHRNWAIKNPEQRQKIMRQWKKNNLDKSIIYEARRRTRKQYTTNEPYTVDDLEWMRIMQNDKCPYCRTNLNDESHLDHMMPLSRGGHNNLYNLQWTCAPCNMTKGTKTDQEYRCNYQ